MAYDALIRSAEVSARRSKVWALVERPITNLYHLDRCYVKKLKYQDLRSIEIEL